MKLVLATRNLGKVSEFIEMLGQRPNVTVLSLKDFRGVPEVLENGSTYRENARKKAVQISEAVGCLTLADDSGLEVDALAGAPGVHSARYAGVNASDADRIQKLLAAMKDVPDCQRTARFTCAVAIASPRRRAEISVAVCEGWIVREPRGSTGFGYDSIFVPNGYECTFAELGGEVKNRISHRAKALRLAMVLI